MWGKADHERVGLWEWIFHTHYTVVETLFGDGWCNIEGSEAVDDSEKEFT